MHFLKTGQRFFGLFVFNCYRVTDWCAVDIFNTRDNKAYFTSGEDFFI